jgi:hypothetical protein
MPETMPVFQETLPVWRKKKIIRALYVPGLVQPGNETLCSRYTSRHLLCSMSGSRFPAFISVGTADPLRTRDASLPGKCNSLATFYSVSFCISTHIENSTDSIGSLHPINPSLE